MPRSPDLIEIQNAIDAEMAEYPEAYRFVVGSVQRESGIWKVFVQLQEGARHGLDEGLEGASAWWPGTPPGRGDVLSVIPEDQQINLRFAATAPLEGQSIFLYPAKYLDPLKERWDDEQSAEASLAWLRRVREDNRFSEENASACQQWTRLRERQREAFRLTGWDAGFLWGPPGTGKTHTLGELLAQFLIARPSARVLLLSTTNTAVDQALVSVDRALERLAVRDAKYDAVRRQCARIGNHFIASNYEARRHLLPVKDEALVKRLSELESERPDPAAVASYAAWKRQVEEVRSAVRAQSAHVLRRVRLAALTTTRALFTFDELNGMADYDLVIFDEASQVPIIVAAALAPLARRAMFAGDPQQLAPIVRSDRDDCQRWFGRSMFEYRDATPPAVCQLNEQSRMAAPICRIVSGVFYDGDLRVAADCEASPRWLEERSVPTLSPLGSARTYIQPVGSSGRWNVRFGGMVRDESAQFISAVATEIVRRQSPDDVLILTPFRAQRALIRSLLRNADLKITVSTVHRAQGSERHTIIFDPVEGSSPFLQTEDARRLMNVAISRAQARLILALSASDQENPTLKRIVEVIGSSALRAVKNATPVGVAIRETVAPQNLLNQVLAVGDIVGRVVSANEEELKLADATTGRIRKFKMAVLRNLPVSASESPVTGKTEQPKRKVLRASLAPAPKQSMERHRNDVHRTPAPVLRATLQPLISAPRASQSRSAAIRLEPAAAKVPENPPMRGKVTQVRPGSGRIAAQDGRVYEFAYVNLGPELKLKGVEEGAIVGFTPGPPRAGIPSAEGVCLWKD